MLLSSDDTCNKFTSLKFENLQQWGQLGGNPGNGIMKQDGWNKWFSSTSNSSFEHNENSPYKQMKELSALITSKTHKKNNVMLN